MAIPHDRSVMARPFQSWAERLSTRTVEELPKWVRVLTWNSRGFDYAMQGAPWFRLAERSASEAKNDRLRRRKNCGIKSRTMLH
jgi:hypothetical protein